MPRRHSKRPYATVQAWMKATGTSQRELAKLLQVSESHLCNILRGNRKPSFNLALDLSAMTNVPIETVAGLARIA